MTVEINLPDVVAEVQAVFERYERALQANDIATLEELMFWHHTATTRYGVGENLLGWQAISDFRRSGKLGKFSRTLINSIVVTYGRDSRLPTPNINARAKRPRAGRRRHWCECLKAGGSYRPCQPARRDGLESPRGLSASPAHPVQ